MNAQNQKFIRRMREVRTMRNQYPQIDWVQWVKDVLEGSVDVCTEGDETNSQARARLIATAERETGLSLTAQ